MAIRKRRNTLAASRAWNSIETPTGPGQDDPQLGTSTRAIIEAYEDRPRMWWGARHTLALLGFIGFSVIYSLRFNLSVAIVCMVKPKPVFKNQTTTSSTDTCPLPDNWEGEMKDAEHNGEFEWNETTQGWILGSFFYGYLLTNFPGGRAAEYFGGKRVLGIGVLLTAILTLAIPASARISTGLFIAVRVAQGLCQGVSFPAMNTLLAAWIPPLERAKFSSLVYAGSLFGTVIALPVSGLLCHSRSLGGWSLVFYVFGCLALVWCFFWFLLIVDHPELHPRISEEEKEYLIKYCPPRRTKPVKIPWKSLITSIPLWFLTIAHIGQNWGFYTLITALPTYLKNIQHFDMRSNGFVSGLPYLVMCICTIVYSDIVDRLLEARKLSLLTVRRLSMTIGMYGPMLGLVAMCYVNCNKTMAILVLCAAVGLNGAVYSGHMCSHQDMAPNLAGTLMGITNSIATIPGFITPVVTGALTESQTLSAWCKVFLISAGVYLFTNIGYLLCVPATVQPWNEET